MSISADGDDDDEAGGVQNGAAKNASVLTMFFQVTTPKKRLNARKKRMGLKCLCKLVGLNSRSSSIVDPTSLPSLPSHLWRDHLSCCVLASAGFHIAVLNSLIDDSSADR